MDSDTSNENQIQKKPKEKPVPADDSIIIKKVTTRDIEKWEVAMLNFNMEPCSKPSDVFDKLEEKRRIRHEAVLNKLADDLNEINLNTEKNIRLSSLEVKAHMKYFDDQLKEILHDIDKPEVVSFCSSVFLEYQNKANEFKLQQQQLVNELHCDLNKFENERAEENEKLFHVACEEIRKVGYFLPYDVQSFVENETLKMNQLSLNNRRCYDDLKLTLTLLTEQMYKSFIDKMCCIQENWANQKDEEAKTGIPETMFERVTSRIFPENYTRYNPAGEELKVELSSDELRSLCKFDELYRNISSGLKTIDSYAKYLTELYKKTVNAVYRGFDSEVEELRKVLSSFDPLVFEEQEMKPLLFEGQCDQIREAENLENYWQETIIDIKPLLKDLIDFLFDLGALWERHTERVCESKKLILKAMEKAYENNQTALQELEIKLNINLDALRQEFNLNKLDSAYSSAISTLETIKKKYESNYVNDVLIIEDLYKMMNLEADVLSAEIKEFIYVTYSLDNTKIHCLYCDHYRGLQEELPIFKEILMCTQQFKALKYWKQGIWTALENLSLKTRESLERRAESWVASKIETLAEKTTFQIELIQKRFTRIRVEIYEKRQMEVEFHQTIFDEHKEGVKFVFQQARQNLENLTKERLEELGVIKESFKNFDAKALDENRPEVIRSNQIMLERRKEELENKLKSYYDKFRAYSDTKMLDVRQSNIDFMKDIRLFFENGSYSADEAKTFINLLEGIDKEINSESKAIIKDSTKDENDLVKKCSSFFIPTINLYICLFDELSFNHIVEERLSEFTTEIRNLAENLASDFENLKVHTNCLWKYLRNTERPLRDDDKKFWFLLFEILYKNISNLFYPLEMQQSPVSYDEAEGEHIEEEEEDPCSCRCLEMSKLSAKATISKTPTFRSTEPEETFTCKDYRRNLFNDEELPDNNGTFMAAISNAFWFEMDALQKLACNFYKQIQGRKIIREDLIPPNYDTFAEELLLKFQCYIVQCEQLWLQTVSDFLPTLGSIKVATNCYFERKIEEYQKNALKALKKFRNDFLSCLEAQNFETTRQLQELDDKLLPLHGCPRNKDLLDALEEEVVRQTAGMGISWDDAIKRFKTQVSCFRVNHIREKKEINKIKSQYLELKIMLFIEEIGENLVDLLLEYCNKGGLCARKPPETQDDEENSPDDWLPVEHQLKFQPFSLSFLSIQTYYRQLKDQLEIERKYSVAAGCLPCPMEESPGFLIQKLCWRESKLNILMEPLDCEFQVMDCLRLLDDYLIKLKELAESKKDVHEDILFKWLEVWKFNVKNVEKLYRVKYEEKPEELDKISLHTNGKCVRIL